MRRTALMAIIMTFISPRLRSRDEWRLCSSFQYLLYCLPIARAPDVGFGTDLFEKVQPFLLTGSSVFALSLQFRDNQARYGVQFLVLASFRGSSVHPKLSPSSHD